MAGPGQALKQSEDIPIVKLVSLTEKEITKRVTVAYNAAIKRAAKDPELSEFNAKKLETELVKIGKVAIPRIAYLMHEGLKGQSIAPSKVIFFKGIEDVSPPDAVYEKVANVVARELQKEIGTPPPPGFEIEKDYPDKEKLLFAKVKIPSKQLPLVFYSYTDEGDRMVKEYGVMVNWLPWVQTGGYTKPFKEDEEGSLRKKAPKFGDIVPVPTKERRG